MRSKGRVIRADSNPWDQGGQGLIRAKAEVGKSLIASVRLRESKSSPRIVKNTVGASETSVIASSWAASLSDGTKEVVSTRLVGGDDDVVPLANGDIEPVSGIWLDGDKVALDHFHFMTVEVDGKHILGGSVDQPESMPLARLEGPEGVEAVGVVRIGIVTVEKVVLRATRAIVGNPLPILLARG